MFEVILGSNTV
jgi:hypothetical protein